MNYILDTAVLIDIAKGSERANSLERLDLSGSRPFITLLTYSEYYAGFLSRTEREINACLDFLKKFDTVTITEDSAKIFSELRNNYKKKGISFGTMDLLNASIAIQENMTFITTDKQFEKIAELKKIVIVR